MTRFSLPPEVSVEKRTVPLGAAYVFRHRDLGELGRLLVQEAKGNTEAMQFSLELVGDPGDPAAAKRKAIFEPLGLELMERMNAALGPRAAPGPVILPPRPAEEKTPIAYKLVPCARCPSPVAMLIFADRATGVGQMEDYARMMYAEYSRLNLPTWIIGPPQGPSLFHPSQTLQVWPARSPKVQVLRPEEFDQLLEPLTREHCQG